MKYVLFETAWGWMGLAGENPTLSKLVLPISGESSRRLVKDHLFTGLPVNPDEDANLLTELRLQLIDYFKGRRIDQWHCDIDYSCYPPFTRQVLKETCAIPYGDLKTYGEIAKMVGRPRGSRAVGQGLKRNNTPLVIPCHRVIGSLGKLTGFSAPGGLSTKKALLELEGL